MSELVLYGLDEAGEAAFTERLSAVHRATIRAIAKERLRDCDTVEVWEGPMCIIRLRRRDGAAE